MASQLDEFSGEPLTPLEIKKARKLIRDDERMRWLLSVIRIWAATGAMVLTTFLALKDKIVAVWKAIFS